MRGRRRVAITLAEAKQVLAEVGAVIRKTDGEYRVNFRGGEEATAYYTEYIDDAVLTGKQMAAERLRQRW